MKCPNCGHQNSEGAHSCRNCGAALGGEMSTRPLSEVSTPFAPLPEGALLHDGRYEILEVRAANDRVNIYLTEDIKTATLCPNCQTEISDSHETSCSRCGANFFSVEPLRFYYLIRESTDEHAFAVEAKLLEMGLEHAGLLLPREVFTEAPYGPPRQYMVEPEFSPPPAASLPVPQELNQVLEWGVSLAQALHYLHHHNVTVDKVILNHIAIAGKRASWAHLGTALIIPQADHSTAASHVAQDIQGLGSVLLHLATGEQRAAHDQLPERVATILNQTRTAPARLTAGDLATALDSALQELRRPVSVMHVVGHRTDVGQERALNEDSLLALDLAAVFRSVSAPAGLFAVADGMGGHEAGDVASRLAVQEIARRACGSVLSPALAGKPPPDVGQWLKTTVLAANQSVHDHREAAGTDMGTTLVMALIFGDVATIANVGDSRAYLLNQTEITQISTDHSLVERLVATGQITREEAANHPQRNIIYRVLGDRPEVEADLFQLRLAPGEALLLCSDGLSGMVPDRQIWQTWQTSISPQDACDLLVEAAIQAGGDDNITVVIVQAAR